MRRFYSKTSIIVLLFTVLVLVSAGKTLSFGFWKDDWITYWAIKTFSWQYFKHWLHPGNNIHFLLFTYLLPPNTIGWQILGIFWKVAATFSVFHLTNTINSLSDKNDNRSIRAGIIAGSLFAVTPLGLDTVGWTTLSVLNIDICLISLTLSTFIVFIRKNRKRYFFLSCLYLLCTLFSDPFRSNPIIGVVFLLGLLTIRHRILIHIRQSISLLPVAGFILVLVLSWQLPRIQETVLFQFVFNHKDNLPVLVSKIYVIGNYFASIGNIFLGPFVKVYEEASTGEYSRVLARLSFIILCLLFSLAIWLWKKRHKQAIPFIIFLNWIVLFYIPNWLAEPRLTMGVTHRYMAISGIGWIGIITLCITSLSKRLSIFITIFLVVWMSILSQQYIADWSPYRSRSLTEAIWNTIEKEVPPLDGYNIFFVTTNHPIWNYNLVYSSTVPYAIRRNILKLENFPLLTNDVSIVSQFLCKDFQRIVYGQGEIPQRKMLPSQVFSWNIQSNGSIQTTTLETRKFLAHINERKECIVNE